MKMLIILAVKIRFEVVNIIIRIRSKRVVISKYGGVFKPFKFSFSASLKLPTKELWVEVQSINFNIIYGWEGKFICNTIRAFPVLKFGSIKILGVNQWYVITFLMDKMTGNLLISFFLILTDFWQNLQWFLVFVFSQSLSSFE